MRTATSIPRMYADERGLKYVDRCAFENDRKNPRNPRESTVKKFCWGSR